MKILRKAFSVKEKISEKVKKIKEAKARREDYELRDRYNQTDDEEIRREWRKIANKDLDALEANEKRGRKVITRIGAAAVPVGAAWCTALGAADGSRGKELLKHAGAGAVTGLVLTGIAGLSLKAADKKLEKKIKKAQKDPESKEAKELDRMKDNLKVADGKMSRKAFEKKYYKK